MCIRDRYSSVHDHQLDHMTATTLCHNITTSDVILITHLLQLVGDQWEGPDNEVMLVVLSQVHLLQLELELGA